MLLDDAAANASLASSYGAARDTSNSPVHLELALFHGDPAAGGTELEADGGYVPLTVDNDATTWPDAPADRAITSAVLDWPAATGEYSDTVTHALIRDADTGVGWDTGRLAAEISISEAGQFVRAQVTVYDGGDA